MMSIASQQVPAAGELVLDHVAHFVPHIDAASSALETLGFTLTPFSAHSHRSEPGGPLVPAGAGNRCVILERGYLEIVTPTGDTPHAGQLRAAIKRYSGAHLIAFGTAAPEADHARIRKSGFDPLPPVSLQRQIGTESGEGTVRFTVVRVPPGTMPEGRIQFCRHHTPELVWQERWLDHPNRAAALTSVILCVPDAREAAQRFARYTGLLAQVSGSVWRIDTARGRLLFLDRDTLHRRLDVVPPSLPWIAGYMLESADIAATGDYLRNAGVSVHVLGSRRLMVKLPAAVGGIMIFEPKSSGALNFD
ncbi:MAG: VOC family protein [Betaproteobacteria bacterium]|nr:VOC family protein [Betaproteobacteria bacterium]